MRLPSSIVIAVFVTLSLNAVGEVVNSSKVNGTFPNDKAIVVGSGSGLIVGKRLILTNRHVANDDAEKPFDGFRIYLGPGYSTFENARLIATCKDYDLALLETEHDLDFDEVTILDGVPELSTKVTAYGFPLGSRFGVGLTTTGGQVSRHPVRRSEEDVEDDIPIKSALWHDAVLASGNSGGPLFSDNVLVGLNFAYLSQESKHALAVPGTAIAGFLRSASVTTGVPLLNSVDRQESDYSPSLGTVYIEILSSSESRSSTDEANGKSAYDQLIAKFSEGISALSDSTLDRIEEGEFILAFPPTAAANVETGDVARIQGQMMLVEITEEIVHAKIDGARFFILLPKGGGGELQAKIGDVVGVTLPVDSLYYVGSATSYTTVIGSEQYAIPLIPLAGLADDPGIKKVLANERKRRDDIVERKRKAVAELRAVESKKARTEAETRFLARIRHTFTSSNGKFTIDAAATAYDEKSVRMLRLSDNKILTIPVSKLDEDDRRWLITTSSWIRLYGPQLERLRAPKSEEP